MSERERLNSEKKEEAHQRCCEGWEGAAGSASNPEDGPEQGLPQYYLPCAD